MARRNYIFTNKKHSQRAIMSTILGIISTVSLGIVVYLTYRNGEATIGYGVTGLLATIFSIVGLILGVLTVRVKEYYRLFPWLGIILNLIALCSISFMLYFGSSL
uniref:DUF6142 family protein n=1 Tax=Acetatifactor sp. TaxID=1872090 RepID=UPI004055E803